MEFVGDRILEQLSQRNARDGATAQTGNDQPRGASDAGLPAISDPGARLVVAALDAGVSVTVLPGASVVEGALGSRSLRFTVTLSDPVPWAVAANSWSIGSMPP